MCVCVCKCHFFFDQGVSSFSLTIYLRRFIRSKFKHSDANQNTGGHHINISCRPSSLSCFPSLTRFTWSRSLQPSTAQILPPLRGCPLPNLTMCHTPMPAVLSLFRKKAHFPRVLGTTREHISFPISPPELHYTYRSLFS